MKLTEQEKAFLLKAKLPNDAPLWFDKIVDTQHHLARLYGGINHGGYRYTYQRETDSIIRNDALAVIEQRRGKK